MRIKPISNSPGYTVNEYGEVFNKDGLKRKTFLKKDGYVRIGLNSLRHGGRRVNTSIHLIVAEEFLGLDRSNKELQVNHIDGNKLNNHVSNLEICDKFHNINHAHEHDLYTYNVRVTVYDMLMGNYDSFRSIRSVARDLNVSNEFIIPRILPSSVYPLYGRYVFKIDYFKYWYYTRHLKATKTIYTYDHIYKRKCIITAERELSVMLGIKSHYVSEQLKKYGICNVAGFTFSTDDIEENIVWLDPKLAKCQREIYWKEMMCVGRPKSFNLKKKTSKSQKPMLLNMSTL